VKDLEAKLTSLQHQSVTLNGENERLRREIAKIATENDIGRGIKWSDSIYGRT
jgi:AP-1-like transcription factor